MNEWKTQQTVEEYAKKAMDPDIGKYEYTVNFPDLLRMIPEETDSVLDFGCGPGEFTHRLAKKYNHVDGADIQPMLNIAKSNFPELNFFEWDGITETPSACKSYDLIFSKLTIQFIDDLSTLIQNFYDILTERGAVLVSVPNPEKIVQQCNLDPAKRCHYDDEIGDTGIKINPIYMPKGEYIEIFEKAGFILVEESMPLDDEVRAKGKISSRLNMLFRKK